MPPGSTPWRGPLAALVLLAGALLAGCGGGREQPATPASQPPMPAAAPSDFFGINGHVMRWRAHHGELEQLERNLAHLPGGGIGFVRADVVWRTLQPEAPTGDPASDYEYDELDVWVAALAERRLRWQPILGLFVPEWAADPEFVGECGRRSAPGEEALDDYADAFAALASRYGRNGSFWAERDDLPRRPVIDYEVWNEPNHFGPWCPHPDPPRYAWLYAAAREAIQAVDPKAKVMFGGLAAFREDEGPEGARTRQSAAGFIEEAVEALPEGTSIDLLGAHSYGPPARMFESIALFRSTLDRLGLERVPIAFNEYGWSRGGAGARSEPDRVRFMREVTRALATNDCRITRIAPHTWVTTEENEADVQHFFGIADPESGAPYDSGLAYLELARELGDRPRPSGGNVQICAAAP